MKAKILLICLVFLFSINLISAAVCDPYSLKRQSVNDYTGSSTLSSFPMLINMSTGFNFGSTDQIVWTSGTIDGNNYLCYNDNTNYTFADSSETTELEFEVSLGNATSSANFGSIYTSQNSVVVLHGDVPYYESSQNLGITPTGGNITINNTAIIGNSLECEGTSADDRMSITDSVIGSIGDTDEVSYSVWVYWRKTNGDGSSQYITSHGSGQSLFFFDPPTNDLYYAYGAGSIFESSAINAWEHWVVTHNTTTVRLYKNGIQTDQATGSFSIGASNTQFFCSPSGGNRDLDALVDELFIFNRTLNNDEILALHQMGNISVLGSEISPDNSPVVTLNSPPDMLGTNNSLITFNSTITDDIGILSATLYIDGIANQTVTNSTPNQLSLEFVTTVDVGQGKGNWTVTATDTGSNIGTTSTRTFDVDSFKPVIMILFPTNTIYNYLVSEINYSATNGGSLKDCWYSLDGGVTNSTPIVCNSANFTGLTPAQGNNNWTVWANDSVNNLGEKSVFFVVDTLPPVFTVVPANLSINEGDSVSETFTATDTTNVTYFLDDTTNFNIDMSTGLLTNVVTLVPGTYVLTITASDTFSQNSTVAWQVVVSDTAGEGIVAVCSESDITWTDGAGIAGLIMTIMFVAIALGALFLAMSGVVDLGRIGDMFTLENAPAAVVLIGLVFLVMATMSFLIAGAVCPAFGVG
jgi:hypothetical protein